MWHEDLAYEIRDLFSSLEGCATSGHLFSMGMCFSESCPGSRHVVDPFDTRTRSARRWAAMDAEARREKNRKDQQALEANPERHARANARKRAWREARKKP